MALSGDGCDPWQRLVLEGALGERADGRWSAFEVALIVPRQNGKNFILEARELAGLFFFGEKEIIHSAHRLDTARDAFRKFEHRVRSTPAFIEQVQGYTPDKDPFDHRITGIRTSAGEMSIQLKNGNKISWRTRVNGTGRGLTGDLVIFDEALFLDPEDIAAMMPMMAARSIDGNPQIWYTSSAGLHHSYQLASVRERGMAGGEERLAYFEWSAPDDADSDDKDAWYTANPSLGIRIGEEYVEENEYRALEDEQFRRERLGIWAKLGGDAAISPGAWKKILDAGSVPSDTVVFAVDVPPTRDSASIAVASPLPDGKVHVELVDRRVGTSWVAERLVELQEAWQPRFTVIEAGSAAGALIPELRKARVRLKQVTMRDYLQGCGRFFDAVKQGQVKHIGQEELNEAVGVAEFKFVGDSLFKWNRKTLDVDIAPLVAATLAFSAVQVKPTGANVANTGRGSGWKVIGL